MSRGYAAQTLKFWQFYSPGGGVVSQDKWYADVVKGWNDSHDVKVELVYVPNNAYMDGTKLPTAFAAGAGPDLFIISPGDFLRYYNGGVLLELIAVHGAGGAGRLLSRRHQKPHGQRQDLRPSLRGRADGDVLQHRRLQ